MKYVITQLEENIHEVVLGIIEANSPEEIRDTMYYLGRPYDDAYDIRNKTYNMYGREHLNSQKAQKRVLDIGEAKVMFGNREFPIYWFTKSSVQAYQIIPLEEFIQKHTL